MNDEERPECCPRCGREVIAASDVDDRWCLTHGYLHGYSTICRLSQIVQEHDYWRVSWFQRQDGTRFSVAIPAQRPAGKYWPLSWDDAAEAEMVERIQESAWRI